MQHKLCSSCEGWQIHAEDRVCGNCGDILLKAKVEIIPAVVYKDAEAPDNIQITAQCISGNLDGTKFIWRRVRDNEEVPLDIYFNAGSTTLDLDFPFDKLSDDHKQEDTWELVHRIMEGCEPVLGSLNIGKIKPELKLDIEDLLLADNQDFVTLHLTNVKGSCFNISGLHITTDAYSDSSRLPVVSNDIENISLCEGKTLDIPLSLPQDLVAQLQGLPAGFSFMVNISSQDLAGENAILDPAPTFRIRVQKPAKPTLKHRNNEIKALQNGRINLPVTIDNRGGEPCTINGFEIAILGNNKEPIKLNIGVDSYVLDLGESKDKILQIPLEDIELPEANYFLNIIIKCDDDSQFEQQQLRLDIVKPELYKGIIVIDFGTTASAAAYYTRTGIPKVIPLSDEGSTTYIPTAIAYYLDEKNNLQSCIGEQAVQKYQELPAEKICFLDNLKWRLSETKTILLPDRSVKQWWEAAADYLKAVKQRIEGHQDIMAIVKNVCITQPARFEPHLSNLLQFAYQESGMRSMVIHSDDKPVKTISESWPASMLSLRTANIAPWQQRYLGEEWKTNNEKYLWLNLDMGGGSTDLSLMTIDIEGYDSMQVKEISCAGDNVIAGNLISSLIFKHISFIETDTSSDESSQDFTEIDLSNYPIVLPWDDNTRDTSDTEIATHNGHQIFNDIIFPIQKSDADNPGIIQETFDSIIIAESTEVQSDLTKLWLDSTLLEKKSVSEVFDNLNEAIKYNIEENPFFSLSVTLKNIYGAKNTFSSDQINFNAKAFIEDLINRVTIPLYDTLMSLLNEVSANDYQDRKLLLLLTGRGSMFPVLSHAFETYFTAFKEQVSGGEESDYQAIIGDKTKTIVCEGACYIGHLLSQGRGFNGISFEPLDPPPFGFLNGSDKETGHYKFVFLAHGIIYPEDGWRVTQYPVRSGSHNLNITFCQNLSGKETFNPNDDNRFNIGGVISFSEKEKDKTYLMIRMLVDGKLEASIGIPPTVEDGKNNTNHENWEKQVLGTFQLLPNTLSLLKESKEAAVKDKKATVVQITDKQ